MNQDLDINLYYTKQAVFKWLGYDIGNVELL